MENAVLPLTESEVIGKAHVTLGQRLLEELHHSVKEFKEQQRDVRKKTEDTVKRSAAHKKTCYERNNRMRLAPLVGHAPLGIGTALLDTFVYLVQYGVYSFL